jgi:hypothetical protein
MQDQVSFESGWVEYDLITKEADTRAMLAYVVAIDNAIMGCSIRKSL